MLNNMAVFGYETSLEMAFSDNPLFPTQEVAAEWSGDCTLEIEEWQTYYARFYTEQVPTAIEQSNYVVKISQGLLELNFRNFVGLSKIGDLCLHVHNRKISSEVYQKMLDELADRYSSLVFSFATPVGQHYDKGGPGQDTSFVEYLFLRRYFLHNSPDIGQLGDILAYDPHRRFVDELQSCTIDQCRNVGSRMVHALLSGPMTKLASGHVLTHTSLTGALHASTGRNLFPTIGIREVKSLTVDTNENRFVKFFLESLLAKLEKLGDSLCGKGGGYFNPDISGELSVLHNKISRFLSHNMWREVGPMKFIPANSQVLQRKDGYRQIFRLHSLLQLATRCDFLATNFQNLVEIKDVPTLYEYWCFFQIKTVMDSLSVVQSVTRIVNESPLKHDLSAGLCVEYKNDIKLFFNKTYNGSVGINSQVEVLEYNPGGESYSHTLRPDIIIHKGMRRLIFDAKYKGERSGFYGSEDQGTIQTWKDEDIDKMHSYRDAIRGVMGSFILYPGLQNIIYPVYGSNDVYNAVGAVALRPKIEGMNYANEQSLLYSIISSFLKNTISQETTHNG